MSSSIVRVGHLAPTFTVAAVVNGAFEQLSRDDYKGQWLVLAFVPMVRNSICPDEIFAFSDANERFKRSGVSVAFASTDSKDSLRAWATGINIPLISDENHRLGQAYGVLNEDDGVALNGLFIIDPEGIVRQITISDLPIHHDVEEVLNRVNSFQFFEYSGVYCSMRCD